MEAPKLGKSSTADTLRPDWYAHASHDDDSGEFISVHLGVRGCVRGWE